MMGSEALKIHRATGNVAIASTLAATRPINIVAVKLHLSAAGGAAENFTVTIDSATDPVYDTVLFSQDMTTVQDISWVPESPIPVMGNDEIDFAYNNGNTRTYGLEVTYSLIGV
jgi:hypothetical protein